MIRYSAYQLTHPNRLRDCIRLNVISTRYETTSSKNDSIIPDPNDFQRQRTSYNATMHELRKFWLDDYRNKQSKLDEAKKLSKKITVAGKAIRLRSKREESILKQQKSRRIKDEFLRIYRERLAFQLIKREDELKAQKKRYEKLVNDLNEEQDFWVTENNIESKIIPDLFRDVATTGLVTPYSHFWRQQALTFHEKRILSPEMENRISIRNPEDVALFEADKENQKVEAMESFLDGFVQTGEDRQKLRSIAKNIMSHDIELPELDIVHSTFYGQRRGENYIVKDGEEQGDYKKYSNRADNEYRNLGESDRDTDSRINENATENQWMPYHDEREWESVHAGELRNRHIDSLSGAEELAFEKEITEKDILALPVSEKFTEEDKQKLLSSHRSYLVSLRSIEEEMKEITSELERFEMNEVFSDSDYISNESRNRVAMDSDDELLDYGDDNIQIVSDKPLSPTELKSKKLLDEAKKKDFKKKKLAAKIKSKK